MNIDKASKWCAVGGVALLAIAILMGVGGAVGTEKNRHLFMNECQMDGLKHYQCVSLWNGSGLPVFRSRDMAPLS